MSSAMHVFMIDGNGWQSKPFINTNGMNIEPVSDINWGSIVLVHSLIHYTYIQYNVFGIINACW